MADEIIDVDVSIKSPIMQQKTKTDLKIAGISLVTIIGIGIVGAIIIGIYFFIKTPHQPSTFFNIFSTPEEMFKNKKLILYSGIVLLLISVKKGIEYILNTQNNTDEPTKNYTEQFNKYIVMVLLLVLPLSHTNIYNNNLNQTSLFVGLSSISLLGMSLLNHFLPNTIGYYDSNIAQYGMLKYIIMLLIVITIFITILIKVLFKSNGLVPLVFIFFINLLSFLYVHFANNKKATRFAYWMITYIYLLFLVPNNTQTIVLFSVLYASTIFGIDYTNFKFFTGDEDIESKSESV